jgi:type IV secretory pathway VirB6-like protein
MRKLSWIGIILAAWMIVPGAAFAAGVPGVLTATVPADACTTGPAFAIDPNSQGIVSPVFTEIRNLTDNAAETLFTHITQDAGFKKTVYAVMTLFITMYGALILMGVVQISLGDGIVRLVKLAVMFAILGPGGWTFFYDIVGKLFMDGTDELINQMTQIAMGVGGAGTGTAQPLVVLDNVLRVGFSAKIFTIILALPFQCPYGILFFILILFGLGTALVAIMNAVWVYLISYVAKSLLFGLAPIFFTCLFFQKTRPWFDGWLAQVISFSLQPIFLFAFLGFYMTLIKSALTNILDIGIEACWTEIQILAGTPFTLSWWRFTRNGEPISCGWDAPFPMDIVDVLIFILLAQLAYRHASVVVVYAKEISGSAVFLSQVPESAMQYVQQIQGRVSEAGKSIFSGHQAGAGLSGTDALSQRLSDFMVGKRDK